MSANDNTNEDSRPIGDRLRDLIDQGLEDARRHDIQAAILDQGFTQIADNFDRLADRVCARFFNQVAQVKERAPQNLNPFIVDMLTAFDPVNGGPKFDPNLRISLSVNNTFLDMSPQDIKEMPGYIRLHEKAREHNVSLNLMNVTADEVRNNPFPQPATLMIDFSKTYASGAIANASLYPDLPPRKVAFDRKAGGDFNL